jgi:hypothetical protein
MADLSRTAFPAMPATGATRAFIVTAFMVIVARGDVGVEPTGVIYEAK